MNANERRQFVEELALKLYSENRLSCHYSEFASILRERFSISDAAQIDYLQSDVQNCTFLTRDAGGNYRFEHKSFLEFFVAQILARDIVEGSSENLAPKPLPLEIRDFLVDALRIDPPSEVLRQWLNSEPNTLRDNALSLLVRLGLDVSGESLEQEPVKDRETRLTVQFLLGDIGAFDSLYDIYRPSLRRFFAGRRADEDADDLTSEVFLRAWTRRDNFNEITNFKGYVLGIARNVYREWARRKNWRLSEPIADPLSAAEIEQRWQSEFREREAIQERTHSMASALDNLSYEDRKLIEQYYGDSTTEKLAKDLGISLAALRTKVFRITTRLREEFKSAQMT